MAYNTEPKIKEKDMQLSESVRKQVLNFQQTEITEHHIYNLRARIAVDEANGGPLAPFDLATAGALRAIDLREVRTGTGDDEPNFSPCVLVTLVVQRGRVTTMRRSRRGRALARGGSPVILWRRA